MTMVSIQISGDRYCDHAYQHKHKLFSFKISGEAERMRLIKAIKQFVKEKNKAINRSESVVFACFR